MPANVYADYLNNQLFCYQDLEERASAFGLFSGIEALKRSDKMKDDLVELGGSTLVCESSKNYAAYLKTVAPERLWAHIYVRHFADMYGGQMIKKVAPGLCSMYEFDDKAGLILKVREKLNDDMADEAKTVFGYAIKLFDELSNVHNIQPA